MLPGDVSHTGVRWVRPDIVVETEFTEPLTEDDLFQPGDGWRDKITKACAEARDFQFPPIDVWTCSDKGLTVDCNSPIANAEAATAFIPWSELKPLMKADAPVP
jgi:hypothetical protein